MSINSPAGSVVEVDALHPAVFGTRPYSDAERNGRQRVEAHSLGWVVAGDDGQLVGFANVVGRRPRTCLDPRRGGCCTSATAWAPHRTRVPAQTVRELSGTKRSTSTTTATWHRSPSRPVAPHQRGQAASSISRRDRVVPLTDPLVRLDGGSSASCSNPPWRAARVSPADPAASRSGGRSGICPRRSVGLQHSSTALGDHLTAALSPVTN